MHDALGATLRAHTMRSEPFAREAAAWVLFSEAAARERALAASEYASIAHLLLAWHVLWGPFRGGDSRLIYVVTRRILARRTARVPTCSCSIPRAP